MVNVRVSAVFMDLKLSGLQRIQEDVYSKMNFYFQLKFHAKARGVYNCLFGATQESLMKYEIKLTKESCM